MFHGCLPEWFIPRRDLGSRFSVDGRQGSLREEILPNGRRISREDLDCGFQISSHDSEYGVEVISQTSEKNMVAMGRYITAYYDLHGQLAGIDISLLCVGIFSAKAGIPEPASRIQEMTDHLLGDLDIRMLVDLANHKPGIIFFETSNKGAYERILGGALLVPTSPADFHFSGPTPLFGLPISVSQDPRVLSVTVSGEDGYSWAQLSRNYLNPNLIRYGMEADEIRDTVLTVFPPIEYLANTD